MNSSHLRFWFLCFVFLVVATVAIGVSIRTVPYGFSSYSKEKKSAPALNSTESVPATDSAQIFRVKRVVDGDTIQLENGDKIRYIGVNTPETVDPRRPVQCFGKEAKEKNRELVEGKLVRLEKDISEIDKYGRKLRYVYIGETFINSELVRLGYATVDTVPPDIHFSKLFRSLEGVARAEKIGLWKSCRG
ncbi:thermonuclease family protein [Candidatus Gottesmanbacteria bacterium]|nr:thermonuclease family protein [Candidatus Gottesmanbacteria bacterium]